MVTFLSSSPELSKREHTSYVFKLFRLCLGYLVPEPPIVSFGPPNRSGAEIDLAEVTEPLQSFLLTSSAEQNIFLSAESFSSCVKMLANFGDKALQTSCDPWSSVDFHGRAKIHADLTKAYEDVIVAANVETEADVTLSTWSTEELLPEKKHPAQRPRIDLGQTSKAVNAKACDPFFSSWCWR